MHFESDNYRFVDSVNCPIDYSLSKKRSSSVFEFNTCWKKSRLPGNCSSNVANFEYRNTVFEESWPNLPAAYPQNAIQPYSPNSSHPKLDDSSIFPNCKNYSNRYLSPSAYPPSNPERQPTRNSNEQHHLSQQRDNSSLQTVSETDEQRKLREYCKESREQWHVMLQKHILLKNYKEVFNLNCPSDKSSERTPDPVPANAPPISKKPKSIKIKSNLFNVESNFIPVNSNNFPVELNTIPEESIPIPVKSTLIPNKYNHVRTESNTLSKDSTPFVFNSNYFTNEHERKSTVSNEDSASNSSVEELDNFPRLSMIQPPIRDKMNDCINDLNFDELGDSNYEACGKVIKKHCCKIRNGQLGFPRNKCICVKSHLPPPRFNGTSCSCSSISLKTSHSSSQDSRLISHESGSSLQTPCLSSHSSCLCSQTSCLSSRISCSCAKTSYFQCSCQVTERQRPFCKRLSSLNKPICHRSESLNKISSTKFENSKNNLDKEVISIHKKIFRKFREKSKNPTTKRSGREGCYNQDMWISVALDHCYHKEHTVEVILD